MAPVDKLSVAIAILLSVILLGEALTFKAAPDYVNKTLNDSKEQTTPKVVYF